MGQRKKTSIIWSIPRDKLQRILSESETLAEALRKISVPNLTSGYYIIKERIKEDGLDIKHITLGINSNKNRKFKKRKYPDSNEKVFIKKF